MAKTSFIKDYTSDYPEITMDGARNSVNTGMIKQITIEEWYDLLHHTHKVDEFVDKDLNKVRSLAVPLDTESEDLPLDQQIVSMINTLTDKVNALTEKVNSQQQIIETQTQQIESLTKQAKSHIDVVDWDATTPEPDPVPGT